MTDPTETLIVCPDEESKIVETFAIVTGAMTLIGSIIAYFAQGYQERNDAIEAKEKEEDDLDRSQALERVRNQLSTLIGPMHRLWKVQTTISMVYRNESGHGFSDYPHAVENRGQSFWMTMFDDEFLNDFIEDPQSIKANLYRNFVRRRLRPIYTRIRELVLSHMSDLADMPPQEEWLQRYNEEDVKSPHTKSVNINVIFDSYVAFTFEFDDVIEGWEDGCFRRMQPRTRYPMLICNDLIDLLYDRCKEKEAKYNKHVTVHKNIINVSLSDQMSQRNEIKLHKSGVNRMFTENKLLRRISTINEETQETEDLKASNPSSTANDLENRVQRLYQEQLDIENENSVIPNTASATNAMERESSFISAP